MVNVDINIVQILRRENGLLVKPRMFRQRHLACEVWSGVDWGKGMEKRYARYGVV